MTLVSEQFMEAVNRRNVDGAMALCDGDGEAWLPTSAGPDTIDRALRTYLDALIASFPDLHVRVERALALSDGVELVEVNVGGTQASDFLGVINQEKYADVDQAWRFVVADGRITSVHAYWCQNMVFRRLGVKRLDELTITDAVVSARKGAA